MLYIVFFRGKLLFGYSDHELQEKGGYDLIHPDDLTYYAPAHQERKNASYLHLLTLSETMKNIHAGVLFSKGLRDGRCTNLTQSVKKLRC